MKMTKQSLYVRKSKTHSFLFYLTLGLFLIYTNPSCSGEIVEFKKIMEMMRGVDIRYQREGHHSNVLYRLYKGHATRPWILEDVNDGATGTVESAGYNKIKILGFPAGWTGLLGTWKFSKKGDRCRIEHTNDGESFDTMRMLWECN